MQLKCQRLNICLSFCKFLALLLLLEYLLVKMGEGCLNHHLLRLRHLDNFTTRSFKCSPVLLNCVVMGILEYTHVGWTPWAP